MSLGSCLPCAHFPSLGSSPNHQITEVKWSPCHHPKSSPLLVPVVIGCSASSCLDLLFIGVPFYCSHSQAQPFPGLAHPPAQTSTCSHSLLSACLAHSLGAEGMRAPEPVGDHVHLQLSSLSKELFYFNAKASEESKRGRQIPSTDLFPHVFTTVGIGPGPGPKLRAKNTIQISHVVSTASLLKDGLHFLSLPAHSSLIPALETTL